MSCKKSNTGEDAGAGETLDPNPEYIENMIISTLQDDVLKEILKSRFDGKTKVGPEVIPLVKQLGNCLIMECCHRAARQALKEGCTEIKVEHIEQCLHQIVLDFP